jgi:hypothetical protein
MKPRIRLGFTGFFEGFRHHDNYFTQLLSDKYEIVVTDQPDYLIYSCYGQEFRQHQCVRIFYTGENLRPNFTECDYAFTFDFCDHPNHMRLPFWRSRSHKRLLPSKLGFDPMAELAKKTRFCNFVYSNKYCPTRNRFFRLLSKYKPVDAGGKLFNNIGGKIGVGISAKLEFIRQYKFTIAFENESYPGYTTEKLFEPLFVNSLPIYWGNPRVDVDFNPACFLNYHDYGSLKALLERVIEVDQNDELYCHYLQQPCFPADAPNDFQFRQQVLAQFDRIFSTSIAPVARKPKAARNFIIHPAHLAATKLKQKSLRLGRKIRYHLDLAQLHVGANRR